MSKTIIWAGATIAVAALLSTPSFALIGIEALDQCVKNSAKGCKILQTGGPGGIVIQAPGGELIDCPNLNFPCIVLGKSGKPKRSAKDYVAPESLGASGSSGGDTGVPGTGSGGGKTLGPSLTDRGPTKPSVVQ
jgi:hypothetical protein